MHNREEVQQKMVSLIEQWKTSGLSQKAFCLQHEVRYYVFHYWYKRYRDAQRQDTLESVAAQNAPSSFIALQITSDRSSLPTASQAELIYPDGRRLLFHQPVDACFLKTIIG